MRILPLLLSSILFLQGCSISNIPTIEIGPKYDVVVIGGEPEGVSAAVSAARNGAKVLLIDSRSKLGGLLTVSEMNIIDIAKNFDNEETSLGIFKEFHNMINNKLTADIEASTNALHTLVENEPNITLKLNTDVTDITLQDSYIVSIEILENSTKETITSKTFIDATADADFSAMSGVAYTYGNEDIGRPNTQMAVTLMMHFKNVDWQKMAKFVKENNIATVYNDVAWGFWEFVEDYEEGEPNTNLRGLNVGHDLSGDVYINALQIFNINGVDSTEKAKAIEIAKRETSNILNWLKKELPGFENAEIAGFPEELYVRETRHIEALYNLTIVDVFENKELWDRVAIGGYPVDIQATDKTQPNLILINPNQYSIPFRSLVPKDVKNLLVTSKASGYESLAAASVRVIPTGMAVGEAGGVSASIASQKNIDFHQMSENEELIKELQNILINNGAFLPTKGKLPFPYEDAPYYEDMKELYTRGLLNLDYHNNLNENKEITYKTYYEDLSQIVFDVDKLKTLSMNKNDNDIINSDDIRTVFTITYGADVTNMLKIPSTNQPLLTKDFVVIKANLVRYLDTLK